MIIESTMRQAFINAKLTPDMMKNHVVKQAVNSLQREAGVRKVSDWNAHLRFGTYTKLTKHGIPASSGALV
jgi:uncharacterized protein YfeS